MRTAHRTSKSVDFPTVLSLTKYIPYPSVTHAGGQYLLEHIRAVSHFARVQLLAPDTPINREAVPKAIDHEHVSLLRVRPRLGGRSLRWWQLESVWAGSSIYWPVRRLFGSRRAPWEQMKQAQIVEFQWSEMIALAPQVRKHMPGQVLVGVAHDIISQRWERQLDTCPFYLRFPVAVAMARSRARESRSFRALDVLLVFSDKDADLARKLAPHTRVEVVHPGLGRPQRFARKPNTEAPVVLFTGAMQRPENWRAVLWFIDEIWPHVLEKFPTARFVVAGANPPDAVIVRAKEAHRVEITGFVPSLEPWYSEASVFVAPLRSGAGVKFKTIDAMLRGVPIVTTSVGAEGIRSPELIGDVVDDAAGFAAAVVRQLTRVDTRGTVRLQEWAESVYGVAAFEGRISGLYQQLL